MKINIGILSSLAAVITLSAPGQAAPGSGAAPVAPSAPSAPSAPRAPSAPNQANSPGTTLPEGLRRGQLPPGSAAATNRFWTTTNSPFSEMRSNEFRPLVGNASNLFWTTTNSPFGGMRSNEFRPLVGTASNQFWTTTNSPFGDLRSNEFRPLIGTASNRFWTTTNSPFGELRSNEFRPLVGFPTNQSGLTPTAQAGGTNRIFGTNFPGMTNGFANTALRDLAFTTTDQTLLVQVRTAVQTQIAPLGVGTAFSPVHFVVRQSFVTLVGSVPTIEERQQVETVVRGVPGVTQVVNNLAVRPIDQAFTPADQALVTQIRQAVVPQVSLGMTVPLRFLAREGVVTLMGTVPTLEDRQRIELLVTQVPGVVRISNQLLVRTPTAVGVPGVGTNAFLPTRFLPPTNKVGP